MIRRLVSCAALLTLIAAPALAESLDDVLARNLEARGGKDAIKAVTSARITGTMTLGQGVEASFVWEWKRPNKIRTEFTVQGMTGIQAFDGTTGWMVMPFLGKTEPEEMPAEETETIKEQADFEGPLVDWKEKGHQVELLGKEPVEGTDAWKLKLTRANGDVTTIYLDGEYYLEIKEEGTRKVRGQELEFETSIGDYKEVDGLMLAHSITSKAKGMPMGQTITFQKIELDVPIDDARFAMPEKKAAEPAAE